MSVLKHHFVEHDGKEKASEGSDQVVKFEGMWTQHEIDNHVR